MRDRSVHQCLDFGKGENDFTLIAATQIFKEWLVLAALLHARSSSPKMAAAPVKPVVAIVTTRMTPGNPKAAIFLTTSSISDRTSCKVGIDEAFSAYLSPDYPIAALNSFSLTLQHSQITAK